MASTRLCFSTQNIPAPLGPRRPSCTRNRTAPLPIGSKKPGAIPVDRFEDVLRDPGYYCEVYPDTLPLTRKLYQQIWGPSAAVFTAAPAGPAQNDPRLSRTRSDAHAYERLETEGDVVVFNGSGDHERQSPGRKLLPIGAEVRASSYSMDYTVLRSATGPLEWCGPDMSVHVQSSFQVERALEMRSEVAMTMDILERGVWSMTDILARVEVDPAIGGPPNLC
ncbi:hypothetical protein PYCCODRAFT_1460149 [Trametes coccinea BRFM310]|uniref:Uncharacterized protein n=1 Tax=Trametes coccinea (strain BRFM310) TaxID=1353009 RepID=A0A1Y2IJD4_TRAC3|nr:hypothetical protein PYCCODRAFT_1460149 [Trametes coccinea BRFM310]